MQCSINTNAPIGADTPVSVDGKLELTKLRELAQTLRDIPASTFGDISSLLAESRATRDAIESDLVARMRRLGHSEATVQQVLSLAQSTTETFTEALARHERTPYLTFNDYAKLRDDATRGFDRMATLLRVPTQLQQQMRDAQQNELARRSALDMARIANCWTAAFPNYVEDGTEAATLEQMATASFPFAPDPILGKDDPDQPPGRVTSTLAWAWAGFKRFYNDPIIALELPRQLISSGLRTLVPGHESFALRCVKFMALATVAGYTIYKVTSLADIKPGALTDTWVESGLTMVYANNATRATEVLLHLQNTLREFLYSVKTPTDMLQMPPATLHKIGQILKGAKNSNANLTRFGAQLAIDFHYSSTYHALDILLTLTVVMVAGHLLQELMDALRHIMFRHSQKVSGVDVPSVEFMARNGFELTKGVSLNGAIAMAMGMQLVEIVTVAPTMAFFYGYTVLCNFSPYIVDYNLTGESVKTTLEFILSIDAISVLVKLAIMIFVPLWVAGRNARWTDDRIFKTAVVSIFTAYAMYCANVERIISTTAPFIVPILSLIATHFAMGVLTSSGRGERQNMWVQPLATSVTKMTADFKLSLLNLLPPSQQDVLSRRGWGKFATAWLSVLLPTLMATGSIAAAQSECWRFGSGLLQAISTARNDPAYFAPWIATLVAYYAVPTVYRRYIKGDIKLVIADARWVIRWFAEQNRALAESQAIGPSPAEMQQELAAVSQFAVRGKSRSRSRRPVVGKK
jgi:hypothetical protein